MVSKGMKKGTYKRVRWFAPRELQARGREGEGVLLAGICKWSALMRVEKME